MVRAFLRDEAGAVTVDWVVLTAAVTGLVLATMGLMGETLQTQVNRIDDRLNAPSIIARIQGGFGYTPHDGAQYDSLMTSMSQLSSTDLAQIAAYSNALNDQITDTTDAEIVGQVADFSAAVDVAYLNAGGVRDTGTTFDETELTRISSDMGYDPSALTGG
ncbi:hypothetical protein JANAI62_13520 [Jannaschia pagri]|uniref:Pilus assembly protein n=1 Tax=Jannaschia pagri TaxID=2829797 RepID=A0ABQ4NK08_9RHOB|nr:MULTISPECIES: hypothetical protein [unclassified Jannaschia]GIT90898.1 hypothetical protein JANAI61_13560 [Jannaschia sp. AI_61]GIT94729.1 hypothetical protein JANAI62_13520 [Jannaschia sp. AI_62]